MKITVNVTQGDIDNGTRRHGCHCPVANALRRALNDCVWVDPNQLTWGEDGHTLTPEEVRKRIIFFDAGGTMEPFTFELETAGGV